MKFFTKKNVMTEEQQAIEKAFRDLEEWILSLQKQSKTGNLGDKESKLLFEIRDMAKGIKKPVTAPTPHPIPKPVLPPMEMKAGAIFAKLDSKRDVMSPEQRMGYDRLSRRFEEDNHTGVTLSFDDVSFLRRLYGTLLYSR
jgi:hypothetical protein